MNPSKERDCTGALAAGEPAFCTTLAKEVASLKLDLAHAAELLALIHRDGGHHIDKVGWKQAVADAITIVTDGLHKQRLEQEASTRPVHHTNPGGAPDCPECFGGEPDCDRCDGKGWV
jgi:hypothetical protein